MLLLGMCSVGPGSGNGFGCVVAPWQLRFSKGIVRDVDGRRRRCHFSLATKIFLGLLLGMLRVRPWMLIRCSLATKIFLGLLLGMLRVRRRMLNRCSLATKIFLGLLLGMLMVRGGGAISPWQLRFFFRVRVAVGVIVRDVQCRPP